MEKEIVVQHGDATPSTSSSQPAAVQGIPDEASSIPMPPGEPSVDVGLAGDEEPGYGTHSMENKKRRDLGSSLNFTTYKKHMTSLLLQWNSRIWLVFLILGFLCSIMRVSAV